MFGLVGLKSYMALAIVALTASGYVLFNSLTNAKAKIKELEAENKGYIVQIEQHKTAQKAFELSHKNIVLQYQELEAKAKKDATREYVAVAKPTLVQKLANKKFKQQEQEMACLTGNKSKCSP